MTALWWHYRHERLRSIHYWATVDGEVRRAEWAAWALERLEAGR